MSKRSIGTARQPIEILKHGAETGSKSKAKKLNTAESSSSSRATTSEKSNKMPVDPFFWPQKTNNTLSVNKITADTRRVEYDLNDDNDHSEDEDHVLDNRSNASHLSDDEPILKVQRIERNKSPIALTGIVPSMTIPEFTIDKNIKHFITDMEAYLSCFHNNITEIQESYLILSAVKGDAKDILLSFTIEQLNTVDKI